jgi:hypothetical protein
MLQREILKIWTRDVSLCNLCIYFTQYGCQRSIGSLVLGQMHNQNNKIAKGNMLQLIEQAYTIKHDRSFRSSAAAPASNASRKLVQCHLSLIWQGFLAYCRITCKKVPRISRPPSTNVPSSKQSIYLAGAGTDAMKYGPSRTPFGPSKYTLSPTRRLGLCRTK